MSTLLLDAVTWDLVLDLNGNIAIADEPYSIAQDCASAIRLKLGELWYNTTIGVPYNEILGQFPPNIPLLKALFVAAAKAVPGVSQTTPPVVFISQVTNRVVLGQVLITTTSGQTQQAAF